MLTEEQIKNLKKGDKLLAEVSFIRVDEDHDLECTAPLTDIVGNIIDFEGHFHPSCLSLPPSPPKHDPCRKFRTGDKVRIVEWNGRIPQYLADCIGSEHTVRYDEDINGGVHIVGDIDRTLACFLELVTPVEELEPYHVETDPHGYHIENGVGLWVATYHNEIHPNAYQAAIDECARLNDRKEVQS